MVIQTVNQNQEAMIDAWRTLVVKAMNNAITGLSQMIGSDIKVTSLSSRRILLRDTPSLVGGREVLTVGVYVGVLGEAAGSGHMLIIYPPKTAFQLIDLLMDEPAGTSHEMGEMEQSVLGEVGNIMGGHFLNTLSDYTGLDLRVTPPAVVLDMAGAILDTALAELMMETDEALVLDTTFGTADQEVSGQFLVLPNPTLQAALVARLAQA